MLKFEDNMHLQGHVVMIIVLLCSQWLPVSSASGDASTEYYVLPMDASPTVCPSQPCYSLSEYVQNATLYITSDSTLRFLPGTHLLNEVLVVENACEVRLVGPSAIHEFEPQAQVICANNVWLTFRNISNVTVQGMAFVACGIRTGVPAVQFHNIVNLKVASVLVEDPAFAGISATNVFGDSTISQSAFHSHTTATGLGSSGGAHIIVLYNEHNESVIDSNFTIMDCEFHSGFGAAIYGMISNSGYSVSLHISNISTNGDFGFLGDIAFMIQSLETVSIRITNSSINNSGTTGITIVDLQSSHASVYVSGCHITSHLSGGIALRFFRSETAISAGTSTAEITIEDSTVQGNVVTLTDGIGLTITYGESRSIQRSVFLTNVTFSRNNGNLPAGVSIVSLNNAQNVTFDRCKFYENSGTSIRAFNSSFHVSGNVEFIDNSATQGGALAFFGKSYMSILNHTHIVFQRNSADYVGGAVYVQKDYSPLTMTYPPCFFQLPDLPQDVVEIPNLDITLTFINNTARSGGNTVYGAIINNCLLSPFIYGYQFFNSELDIVYFDPSLESDLSAISSDPQRVCLCVNEQPECTIVTGVNKVHYPGEEFTVSAVVVGQEFGTTEGSVFAQFLPQGTRVNEVSPPPQLGSLQQTQRAELYCKELKYSILSSNKEEVLVLTTNSASVSSFPPPFQLEITLDTYASNGRILTDLLSFPVYINITLRSCPLGFQLSDFSYKCICDLGFQQHGTMITCNINDQTILRSGMTWINASFAGNRSNGVIVYQNCPFDYCRTEAVHVNMEEPDIQCAFNHSGTLCGACQSELSLALGSSQCLSCSNDYLALLIPFAAAGILLVLFIKVLNLTVSEGTINGLIFYANVIKTNEAVFFPPGHRNPLTVFISWINLDLGIETCFFDGLNAYWKTWLQFVFPLYIWVIIATVIFISRHSATMSRFFGKNSVPILATLFLLSYAKLLRTILISLSYALLQFPDGSEVAVWSFDGNILYLSPIHIPLFVVALTMFIFLWVPYTSILLFEQCLQQWTTHKLLHWLVRLKPFFDAYTGPFKPKHRYWVGLLLLVRIVLFLIDATTSPSVFLLVVAITCICLLMYTSVTSVYRKWYLTLLENAFLSNLALLSVGTLYVLLNEGNQAGLVYPLVSIAFIEYIGIVLYHAMRTKLIHKSKQKYDCISRYYKSHQTLTTGEDERVESRENILTHHSVTLSELREPFLDDDTR